jgi:integrase
MIKNRTLRLICAFASLFNAPAKKCEKVFTATDPKDKQHTFKIQHDRLANKLGNPQLTQITFHTLRHWKATMEYHKIRSQKYVQLLLGHRSILSTDRYFAIEQAIFNDANDEYHVSLASALEEATRLLEVGFEYVTDMDGKMLFRKRK